MKKRRLKRSDKYWLAAVALLILLQFWWLPGDPGTPNDTYSAGVAGKRGFFQTLQSLSDARVLPPVRRETEQLVPNDTSTLVVLSPDRYPNENEQRELAKFVRSGGTLLFAPNWTSPDCVISQLSINTQQKYFREEDLVIKQQGTAVAPAPVTKPQDTADGSNSDSSSSQPLPAEAEENVTTPAPAAVPATAPVVMEELNEDQKRLQRQQDAVNKALRDGTTIQPPTENNPLQENDADYDLRNVADFYTNSPLVDGRVSWRTRAAIQIQHRNHKVLVESTSGTIQAASWDYGDGRVVLCASPDVFSNVAMLKEAQAELAIRLVEHAHQPHEEAAFSEQSTPIIISEFLNASDAYRGTAVLMNPSLRSGTLQLLTIALLIGWFGFHPFGPPRRVNVHHRRSLTESATAVGNLQLRTNNGTEVVERYLDYFKTRLQRIFGRSVGIEDTAAIAVRANMEKTEVARRLAGATKLSNDISTSNVQAATSIRELSQILDRLSGKKRNS